MSKFDAESLELHKQNRGKIELGLKVPLGNRHDLSLAYSPGVAAVSRAVAEDPSLLYEYSPKGNMVLVVSEGSAVLGLGNIGAAGAYPVMAGKCALLKHFAGVDAFPLVLDTQDVDEVVNIVANICGGFGGVNLEDIKAPQCFEIEAKLKERLNIPVFHDDQHGTAIVSLAGLINSMKATGRDKSAKVVINGAGAAGIAIAKLLLAYGFKNLIVLDSKGALLEGRDNMNWAKEEMAKNSNPNNESGNLETIIKDKDVFIGVSKANLVSPEMVKSMNDDPIIFAMANPDPEIPEADAIAAGAAIVATGRSDSSNQLNNVLVFPGLFRGILDVRAPQFTHEMYMAAAEALAGMVPNPTREKIIPSPFEEGVAEVVAEAVRSVA